MENVKEKIKKPKQPRSETFYQNRKHMSFIGTTQDYIRIRHMRNRLARKTKQKVSMSEVMRMAINKLCQEPSFLVEDLPIKRGNKF